jgi:hypothetical protein
VRILKHGFGLLQSLPRRLGKAEEDVEGHGGIEHTEDDVRLPADVGEGNRGKQTQRGIPDVASATPLPRSRRGNSSGG